MQYTQLSDKDNERGGTNGLSSTSSTTRPGGKNGNDGDMMMMDEDDELDGMESVTSNRSTLSRRSRTAAKKLLGRVVPNHNNSNGTDAAGAAAELKEPLTSSTPPPEDKTRNGDAHHREWDVESGTTDQSSKIKLPSPVVMEDDPFYVFREDLLRQLDTMEDGLAQYLDLVHKTDTSVNTHEVKESKKQLKRHIKSAESTLKDLSTTVTAVEKQRRKFRHIDNAELRSRQSLVEDTRNRISVTRQDMNADDVKAKFMTDERAKAIRRAGGDNMGAKSDLQRENSSFIVDNQAKAQLMLQAQDETLDELDDAVERVGQMAGSINEELGEQNRMLNDLDHDLSNAEEQLGIVLGRLAKLVKTKNKCQLGTIICLLVVVIVLFFLVIYS